MALTTVVMLAGAPAILLGAAAEAVPAAKAGGCTIEGTPGDDVLIGTDADDVICGLGGDDKILGRGGDDVLRGGGGDDVVRGGPGDDRVAGGRGNDRVFGQGGDDVVRGDAGNDEVVGGPGNDRLGGFRGADEMKAAGDAGGSVDDVFCGPGPDTVAADPGDVVRQRDCESVVQNDAPTDITLVPASISENLPTGSDIGDLTAVDPDVGDSHTFSLVPGAGSADNALARIDGDSLESAVGYDFEADSSFSVRVRATDEAGEFTEEAFTVTVTDANDAPVAVDDDTSTTEDTQLDLPVSGPGSPAVNDTDQDGDSLSVTAVSSPTGGTASVSGGQVHFVPAANVCGNNAGTFVYTVSDGSGGTDTGTVTVDVTCVDDLPVAVDDDRTVAEDAAVAPLGVLANDTDPENDPITVTAVSDPVNGTTTFTSTNVSYAPDADYCNSPPPYDTFTYTVNGGDTATVRVTVTCANDAPIAVDDDRTTPEDTPLSDPVTGAGSPAANDNDIDGDTLTVTAVTNPTGGTVAIASGQVTFTPTANLCGPNTGSYDYTVSDGANPTPGTDTGTVTIDVTCVNDPPVANDDSRTVTEDSGVTTFTGLLTNDTDVETDPITITGASDPANGSTTFTATDVTYTPDANYCNDPGAAPEDTFTYTVNGGDTATVSVTVTCANDAPVAANDSRTVAEDASATAVNVLGNDTDVEGDAITVSSASDPANGTVVLTGGSPGAHTGLTYQPDPNYCNDPPGTTPDTFTYTVNGGDTATVSVTVTCVDDAPTADDDSATVTLNDAATAIPVLGNDDDVDGGPMAIASASDPTNGTVVLTGGTPGNHTGLTYQPDAAYCNTDPVTPADTFTYTLTPGGDTATVSVTVSCDDPPVAFDDTATVAEDASATAIDVLANDNDGGDGGPKVVTGASDPLHGATTFTAAGVSYTPDPNYCGADSFTYTVNGGDSATVSVTVTCVNDAPVANDDSRTVAEDSGATTFNTVLGNDSDVENDPITITGVSDPANGATSFTAGDVTYTPDANYCNTPPPFDTFTYTVNGGDTATVSVTVTCVPDAPTLDNSAGTTTYAEDTAPVVVDGTVTISNPDGLAITAGGVTLTDDLSGDVLDWTDNNAGDAIVEGTSTGLQVNLTGSGTANQWEAALEAVTFATPSQNPSAADRTATFQVTTTAGSPSDTKLVDAANVDDPPTADADSATVLEDAAATAVTVLANDDDVDGGPMTITAVSNPANGTTAITGGGTGLTYAPDANYCNDPPGTTPDTFTYTLNSGGAPQTATVSMTVTCVNDAPVADDETFSGADAAVGNTSLVVNDPTDGAPSVAGPKKSISGDILAGDADVDGPNALTVVAGTFATNDGGSVTLEADGDFTYVNDPADACADGSDSFDYTVTDGNSPTAGTDTGTVTIAVTSCVWYVSNNGAGNAGTSSAPFDTLAQAETASGANHTIFVFDGDNTTTGYAAGIDLKAGQVLTSEVADLVVGGATLHTGVSGTRPTLTDNNADVVALDDGNTVRGFVIDPQGTGGGIAGASGDTGGGTIDNVSIVDSGTAGSQPLLELDSTTGTFTISAFDVDNSAATSNPSTATGVRLNSAGTVVFTSTGAITLVTEGAKALDVAGTALGASTIDEIQVTASSVGGVALTTTTGTLALGDDTGADLNLTTAGGTGLSLNNAAGVSVGAGGTDSIAAAGGPAVDITGAGSFAFDDVESTNSTGDGINLDTFGTGTFSTGNGSAISGAAGIGFDLNQGSGSVTYDGTISTTAAGSRPVEVTNRSGGTVDFNGTVNGTGSGVNLATNPSATIRFDGGLTLATGTTGAFSATGGGTVVVTDPDPLAPIPDNTLTTSTGTALNVVNTFIGSDDLTFEKISSNGAANGIVLNATGASGGLTVSGNGSACTSAATCTGGAIQNATVAVSLTSTRDVAIDRMFIQNTSGSGVKGTTTTNFAFTNGRIDNSGTGLGAETSNIAFNETAVGTENNLSGTVTITGNTLTSAYYHGIDIFNFNGTIADANISSNTITSTTSTATSKGTGIRLVAFGSASTIANVTKATIANNAISNFPSANGILASGGNGNAAGPAGTFGTVGSATNVIAITNNTLIGNPKFGAFGIGATVNGKGQGNVNVLGNSVTNSIGTAISLGSFGFANLSATVNNNTIVANNNFGAQGIGAGTSQTFGATDTPTLTISAVGNNISQTDGNGILITARDATGQVNATVRDNTVAAPLSGNRNGIRVDAGNGISVDDAVCVDIAGNTSAGSGLSPEAIGLRKQGTSSTVNDFGVEGMGATSSPGVEAFVSGQQDPGSQSTLLISATSGFSNCSSAP